MSPRSQIEVYRDSDGDLIIVPAGPYATVVVVEKDGYTWTGYSSFDPADAVPLWQSGPDA